MATLATLTGSAITTITDSPFPSQPFYQWRTQFSSSIHGRYSVRRRSLLYLSCKGGGADDSNAGAFTIDRRNSPIAPVDIFKCGLSPVTSFDPTNDDLMRTRCCPPYSDKIVDFKPTPPSFTRMRVRRAAEDVVRHCFPKLRLQVHESWLVFPFHHYYLYFFERIPGNHIGDDSFAVPFWNWDSPGGMELPAVYADPSSPL
ncbi:hypothetical protein MRB53_021809 [Persea americana]|uniref:Uncharacterized protein n=1 Tax=Persea americana TaxID=3435 RepID=A0ACC2L5X7_PERAE|nr:hypothetical protein MRB53_021809 [Persea americana]